GRLRRPDAPRDGPRPPRYLASRAALAARWRLSLHSHRQPARRSGNRIPHPDRKERAQRMTAFIALVRRDLRLFFLDKRAMTMSFVAPIVIASFFGYLFGGAADREPSKISVAIVD